MEIEPVTRKEMLMAAAAGESVVAPTPITREEYFLSKIVGSGGSDSLSYEKASALRELLKCVAYDGNSKYAEAYATFISAWGLTGELLSISAAING